MTTPESVDDFAGPRVHRPVGQILLWSGISNLVLVGCFVAGTNFTAISGSFQNYFRPAAAIAAKAGTPASAMQVPRSDNELMTRGVQSTLKVSLAMTRMTPTDPPFDQDAQAEAQAPGDKVETVAFDSTPTAEETQGLRMSPILRKNPRTGELEIGNFKSISLAGDAAECLDLGYSMLGDTETSNDVLDVMAASDTITVARICAKNGSIVLSCRNNQITVSPRQSRPDDKCKP